MVVFKPILFALVLTSALGRDDEAEKQRKQLAWEETLRGSNTLSKKLCELALPTIPDYTDQEAYIILRFSLPDTKCKDEVVVILKSTRIPAYFVVPFHTKSDGTVDSLKLNQIQFTTSQSHLDDILDAAKIYNYCVKYLTAFDPVEDMEDIAQDIQDIEHSHYKRLSTVLLQEKENTNFGFVAMAILNGGNTGEEEVVVWGLSQLCSNREIAETAKRNFIENRTGNLNSAFLPSLYSGNESVASEFCLINHEQITQALVKHTFVKKDIINIIILGAYWLSGLYVADCMVEGPQGQLQSPYFVASIQIKPWKVTVGHLFPSRHCSMSTFLDGLLHLNVRQPVLTTEISKFVDGPMKLITVAYFADRALANVDLDEVHEPIDDNNMTLDRLPFTTRATERILLLLEEHRIDDVEALSAVVLRDVVEKGDICVNQLKAEMVHYFKGKVVDYVNMKYEQKVVANTLLPEQQQILVAVAKSAWFRNAVVARLDNEKAIRQAVELPLRPWEAEYLDGFVEDTRIYGIYNIVEIEVGDPLSFRVTVSVKKWNIQSLLGQTVCEETYVVISELLRARSDLLKERIKQNHADARGFAAKYRQIAGTPTVYPTTNVNNEGSWITNSKIRKVVKVLELTKRKHGTIYQRRKDDNMLDYPMHLDGVTFKLAQAVVTAMEQLVAKMEGKPKDILKLKGQFESITVDLLLSCLLYDTAKKTTLKADRIKELLGKFVGETVELVSDDTDQNQTPWVVLLKMCHVAFNLGDQVVEIPTGLGLKKWQGNYDRLQEVQLKNYEKNRRDPKNEWENNPILCATYEILRGELMEIERLHSIWRVGLVKW